MADVLALAAAGKTPVEIATKLEITRKQVHLYLKTLLEDGKLRRLGGGAYVSAVGQKGYSNLPLPSPSGDSNLFRQVTDARATVPILEVLTPQLPNERLRKGGVRYGETEVHGAFLQANIGPRKKTLQVILRPFTLPDAALDLPEVDQIAYARKIIREKVEAAVRRVGKAMGLRLDWFGIRILETFEIGKRLPHLDRYRGEGVIPTSPTSQIDFSRNGANWESRGNELEAAVEAHGLPYRVLNMEAALERFQLSLNAIQVEVGRQTNALTSLLERLTTPPAQEPDKPPTDPGGMFR